MTAALDFTCPGDNVWIAPAEGLSYYRIEFSAALKIYDVEFIKRHYVTDTLFSRRKLRIRHFRVSSHKTLSRAIAAAVKHNRARTSTPVAIDGPEKARQV